MQKIELCMTFNIRIERRNTRTIIFESIVFNANAHFWGYDSYMKAAFMQTDSKQLWVLILVWLLRLAQRSLDALKATHLRQTANMLMLCPCVL